MLGIFTSIFTLDNETVCMYMYVKTNKQKKQYVF